MIWYYDLERYTTNYLMTHLPHDSFRCTHDPSSLNSKVNDGDLVIFFNYKHSKLYDSMVARGAMMFPTENITHRLRNRATQLKELDAIIAFTFSFNWVAINFFTNPDSPIALCGKLDNLSISL